MKPNAEGLFYSVPADRYHADAEHEIPHLSASIAKCGIMEDEGGTARHMWAACARLNPNFRPKFKKSWDRGSAAHALTLHSGADIVRIDADDWRPKSAQQARDGARMFGKIPILEKDYADLLAMHEAQNDQLEDLEGGNPFWTGKPEVVMRWCDEFAVHGKVYRVWCRARLDWFSEESANLYDYKSTELTANPVVWTRRTMWNQGAPYQAAFYRRGIRRLAQLGIVKAHDPDFLFVLQESTSPFCLSLISVPSDITPSWSNESADDAILRAMVLWHDCLEGGAEPFNWPGYDGGVYVPRPRERPSPVWSGETAAPTVGQHIPSEHVPDEGYETVGSMLQKKRKT